MASKRRVRRRECEGKRHYPDHGAAVSAARRSSWKARSAISAYLCRFCGAWHIGHTPRRVRAAMRARLEGEA